MEFINNRNPLEDFKLGSFRCMFYKNYFSGIVEKGSEWERLGKEGPDRKLLQSPKGKGKTVTVG